MAISFDGYNLENVVGAGGAAVVWKATHASSETEVALKALKRASKSDARISRFQEEIRTFARLQHRGIVMALDVGVIPDEVHEAGPGLTSGHPYCVMEYIGLGTLKEYEHREQLSWRDVQYILTELLDALSYAHARGLVHRDLKPSNILLKRYGFAVRPMITDFGISERRGREDRATLMIDNRVTGTPRYMSPEQVTGKWRDEGPWTDLYALGCIAFWLIHGEPPFDGGNYEVMEQHLNAAVPPLEGTGKVPAGFDGWMQRLMAKRPSDRYRFAVEARRELAALEPLAPNELDSAQDATVEAMPHLTELLTRDAQQSRGQRGALPVDWVRPPSERLTTRLGGAGRRMSPLRAVPLVGRTKARDAIWTALRTVVETKKPRVVVIHGDSGMGKSRLVEWMSQRAHEVGAADVLFANHAEGFSTNSGIGPMLARFLECHNLDHGRAVSRLRALFENPDSDTLYDCVTLADAMPLKVESNRDTRSLPTHRELFSAFTNLFATLTQDHALAITLDDAHRSLESIFFARALSAVDLPLLFLVTVNDEEMSDTARSSLARIEDATHVHLGALAEPEIVELCDRMGCVDNAAQPVMWQSKGNPVLAVQLAREMIYEDTGDENAQTMPISLPNDVNDALISVMMNICENMDDPPRAMLGLETAAALGQEVELDVWDLACDYLECTPDPAVLDLLSSFGVIASIEDGFRFEEGRMVDALNTRSRRSGRWPKLNLECAHALAALREDVESSARQGRHLLHAGNYERAYDLLYDAGADGFMDLSRLEEAEQALVDAQAALEGLDAVSTDPRRVDVLRRSAHTLLWQGLYPESEAAAEKALEVARMGGDPKTIATALAQVGTTYLFRSITKAIEAKREVVHISRTLGDRKTLAWDLGSLAYALGYYRPTEGLEVLLEAEAFAIGPGPRYDFLWVWAELLKQLGHYDEALAKLDEAVGLDVDDTQHAGLRASAEVSLLAGRPAEANEKLEQVEASISGENRRLAGGLARLRGFLLLDSGRYEEARAYLERAIATWYIPDQVEYATLEFGLAEAAAHRADWESVQNHITAGDRVLTTGKIDRVMAIRAEAAADAIATSRQAPNLAGRLFRTAHDLFQRLESQADAARVRTKLEQSQ